MRCGLFSAPSSALVDVVDPLAGYGGTVRVCQVALAVLFVALPVSSVHSAIRKVVGPEAASLTSLPVAFVGVAAGISHNALTESLIAGKVSSVHVATGEGVSPLA